MDFELYNNPNLIQSIEFNSNLEKRAWVGLGLNKSSKRLGWVTPRLIIFQFKLCSG